MSQTSIDKAYEPKNVEEKWKEHWEKNQSFTPNLDDKGEAFSIVIPPPNVTGALHMGHALNLTLQDVLCRHARQLGKNVLWVPGTDHAGIATQNVVERHLAKEGKTRHDFGREAFVEQVWKWKEEYGNRIINQIKGMGASVDWSRERFTMDEGLSQAVRKVFVELYNKDLIYKGKYIVNWCGRCHTALADDEVEYQNNKGKLYHVEYKGVDSDFSIVIATTRPETIVADTAICVHPEDERYEKLIGKFVYVPVIGRKIPIIADRYVDRAFGTGALKVTPCHDHNDWMLGKNHNLEFIQAIDSHGIMNEEAGPYQGLSKEDCRLKIVEDMDSAGQLVKIEELENNVGHCYRCNTVVEPFVSDQWFVASTKLAPAARQAVPEKTQIYPETWSKTYYQWLDNIRDWCISRQIWWGHRIPAWTCEDCGELIVAEQDPTNCLKCNSSKLIQDPDVLDTWFSSSIWPFSTMGFPEKTRELDTFYPTSVLVTGFDILFFWVARMMMLGIEIMDEIPFKHVYIHALVRDAQGKKMSKSTGNVIDPLEMIDKYGTDSLRFTLTAFAAMGRDIKLAEDRIEGYRHFINKLWNASRFVMMNLDEDAPKAIDLSKVTAVHHAWILHRLEEIKQENKQNLASYKFNEAAQGLYKFLWNEFCDWYLELIKPDMRDEARKAEAQYVVFTVLKEILILLNPITPFVTSEIWSALPGANSEICKELFPEERSACLKPELVGQMEMIQQSIVSIRTIRSELNISPGYKLTVLLRPTNDAQKSVLEDNRELITVMAKLGGLEIDANGEIPKASASAVVQGCEIIVHLSGAVDFDAELARLDKELGKIDKELGGLNMKLKNENYIAKARPEIVQRDRDRIAELSVAREKLTVLQERFNTLK